MMDESPKEFLNRIVALPLSNKEKARTLSYGILHWYDHSDCDLIIDEIKRLKKEGD